MKIIIVSIFLILFHRGYAQKDKTEEITDSLQIHVESCFCFLDTSNEEKKVSCYFKIFNDGNGSIFLPQKMSSGLDYKMELGFNINYEIINVDKGIDISSVITLRGHTFDRIDKRIIELKPSESYSVNVILNKMYFPDMGEYKIRFRLQKEKDEYGIKKLKNNVYSKWLHLKW